MASVTRNALLISGINFLRYAIGFFIPVVLARLLTVEQYGEYQQLVLVSNTSVTIMSLSIPISIYYFYKRLSDSRRDYFVFQTTILMLGFGAICFILLNIFVDQISSFTNNSHLPEYIVFFSVNILLLIASEYFPHYLIVLDKYHLYAKYGVVEIIYRALLLITFCYLFLEIKAIVIGLLVFAASRFLFASVYVFKNINRKSIRLLDLKLISEQIKYSLPLALSSLVGLLGAILDKIIITSNFTTSQFAVYTVGALQIPLDTIFQASFKNVLRAKLPELIKAGDLYLVSMHIKTSTQKLAIIVLPLFIFLYGNTETFIVMLFGDNYIESAKVFVIYLLIMPSHITTLNIVPHVFGKTGINLKISVFVVSVNIALSFYLLSVIGYLGPAIATVASQYLFTLLYLLVAIRLIGCNLLDIIPVTFILKILAIGFSALFISQAIDPGFNLKIINFSVAFLMYGIILAIAFLVFRIVTISEIMKLVPRKFHKN